MGRKPSKLPVLPALCCVCSTHDVAGSCIALCRGSNKPAVVPAGIVGTACQTMVLTTVACLHVAAASSAAGGLSAVPLNFQGDRNDRNAGLQAWGHLLGSAVLFNKVPPPSSILLRTARLDVALNTIALAYTVRSWLSWTQQVQSFPFRNQRSRQK